jgi:hypothetical protein
MLKKIFYILIDEKSEQLGTNFPDFQFTNVSFEDAILALDLNFSHSCSHYTNKVSIFPKIITNDSNLLFRLREVYSIEEFKKWCQVQLDENEEREYFINKKHSYTYTLNLLGKEIFEKVSDIINQKIHGAYMAKELVESNFTDEYGQTYYSEYQEDNGWVIIDNINIDLSLDIEYYTWWHSLEIKWQRILKGNKQNNLDKDYIPSVNTLKKILLMKTLEIEGSYLSNMNVVINFEELDLKPLLKFKYLERLELTSIANIKNLDVLKELTTLKILKFGNSKIDTLSFIETLINIEELDLSQTNITDIIPLYSLNKLARLNLNFTTIERLAPLKKLIELQLLHTKFRQHDILNYEKLIGYKIEKVIY